jgi:hypothetical protein
MDLAIDHGRQTDAAVAGRSEGDQERDSGEGSLRRVMIGHLAGDKGPEVAGSTEDDQLGIVRQAGLD